jgi:hypothetical protein
MRLYVVRCVAAVQFAAVGACAASSTEPSRTGATRAGAQPGSPDAALEAPADEERAADVTKADPLPTNTAVLHIGDSFALAGFAQALKPRMKSVGARYEVKSEQSSYTTSWVSKLELIIANTQPDLVIINLGANEVTNTNPPAHAYAVRRIVKLIGRRPCVWVAPPLWRKDTGIVDVIRENSAPCRFFDTDALVTTPIPRRSDNIHPSIEGGAIWADAFWNWLLAERAARPAGAPGPWSLRPSPPEEHRPRSPQTSAELLPTGVSSSQ